MTFDLPSDNDPFMQEVLALEMFRKLANYHDIPLNIKELHFSPRVSTAQVSFMSTIYTREQPVKPEPMRSYKTFRSIGIEIALLFEEVSKNKSLMPTIGFKVEYECGLKLYSRLDLRHVSEYIQQWENKDNVIDWEAIAKRLLHETFLNQLIEKMKEGQSIMEQEHARALLANLLEKDIEHIPDGLVEQFVKFNMVDPKEVRKEVTQTKVTRGDGLVVRVGDWISAKSGEDSSLGFNVVFVTEGKVVAISEEGNLVVLPDEPAYEDGEPRYEYVDIRQVDEVKAA